MKANDANEPVSLTGLLAGPQAAAARRHDLERPHRAASARSGSIDLIEMLVTSGGGLVTWMIVSPAKTSFELPDLALFGTKLATRPRAHPHDGLRRAHRRFPYEKLRYGQLGSGAWKAYAVDGASGAY